VVFSSGTVLELAGFKEYPNGIKESGFREAGGFWLDMDGNGDRCSLIHSDDCYHRTSEWFMIYGHDVAYFTQRPFCRLTTT